MAVTDSLLAPARVTRAQAERFLISKPNGEYTDADVRHILEQYFTVGTGVGLDPLLTVAQMEQTAPSRSAACPRRNPAGIGVTGQRGAGISFPKVARAHLGRLLAYALPANAGTAAQKALIAEAPTWRLLPAAKGSAPTVKGLARSWATDPAYAGKIVNIANAMLKA